MVGTLGGGGGGGRALTDRPSRSGGARSRAKAAWPRASTAWLVSARRSLGRRSTSRCSAPAAELIIVGAGHVARPLAEMGALLGMEVTVLDDRPGFATRERFPRATRVLRVDFGDPFNTVPLHSGSHVVLVTRGHRYDFDALRLLLRMDTQPAYIGMIGSRRRVRATFAKLLEEGVGSSVAGAGTGTARPRCRGRRLPAEIAVAVAAEIVLLRRGGSGRPLCKVEEVLDRFFGLRTGELALAPDPGSVPEV